MIAKPVYDSIICFGDSLTQQASAGEGFVARLREQYERRLDVISRGFSGYTSRQGLALCPQLFALSDGSKGSGKAHLAIIWLGTNDCIAPGYAQHVPEDEYGDNMRAIVTQHFADVDTLLITPTTVVPDRFAGHETDESALRYGRRLQQIAEEVMREREEQTSPAKKLIVVDMHAAFYQAAADQAGGLADLLQEDGLHISQRGYQVVFDAIAMAIRDHLPHLTPEKQPFVFPDWKDLDLAADMQGQMLQLTPNASGKQ